MNEGSMGRLSMLLEEIAEKLAPSYSGKLCVRKYEPLYNGFLPGDEPFLYISEEAGQARMIAVVSADAECRVLHAVFADYDAGIIFAKCVKQRGAGYGVGRANVSLMH